MYKVRGKTDGYSQLSQIIVKTEYS